MRKIKLAVMGSGMIAGAMGKTVQGMDNVEAYAIASRDLARAQEFQGKFGFTKAYGSYEQMLADPEVDLVYIATPHINHEEHAILCARAGKNVLLEKAFALTAAQARNIVAEARKNNIMMCEAIWTRYMPLAKTIQDIVKSGKIGKVTGVCANLCYAQAGGWRLDASRGGSALLDIGMYPLTLVSLVLGDDVQDVTAVAVKNETGADIQQAVVLTYPDGVQAITYSAFGSATDRRGMISGTNGYMVVQGMNNYEAVEVYGLDSVLIERIERPQQITGYEYEVQAAADAILQGKKECEQMPLDKSIQFMELLDRIRHTYGLYYACEK